MIKHLSLAMLFGSALAMPPYYGDYDPDHENMRKIHPPGLSYRPSYKSYEYHESPVMQALGVFEGGCMGSHIGNGIVMTSAKCLDRNQSKTIAWGMTDSRPDPYLVSEVVETIISTMGADSEPDIVFVKVYPLPAYKMEPSGIEYRYQTDWWMITANNKTHNLVPGYSPPVSAYHGNENVGALWERVLGPPYPLKKNKWPWEKEPRPQKPYNLMPGTVLVDCLYDIYGIVSESRSGQMVTRPWYVVSGAFGSREVTNMMIDAYNSPWRTQ